jgi:hypothetical protein
MPRPLGLQTHMSTCLLPRHFQAPAEDTPLPALDGVPRPVRAQHGLGVKLPVRVAHRHRAPTGGGSMQHVGQGRQALALQARATRLPGGLRQSGFVQGGIPPHARAATAGLRQPTQPPPQGHDGDTVLGDQHQGALRRPAPHAQAHVPRPVRQLLGPRAALLMGARRGRKYGQARQGPPPLGPGHGDQPQQAQPAQPAGIDQMAVGRAHGIAVHPFGRALCSSALLQGIVSPQHQGTRGRQEADP